MCEPSVDILTLSFPCITHTFKLTPLTPLTTHQADLAASLRARVDLVLEDALAAWEAQTQQQKQQQQQDGNSEPKGPQHPLLREGGASSLSRPVALHLPQRVLVPWMVSA
jgi:hypothetical protein